MMLGGSVHCDDTTELNIHVLNKRVSKKMKQKWIEFQVGKSYYSWRI